jgi:hypothetical protein
MSVRSPAHRRTIGFATRSSTLNRFLRFEPLELPSHQPLAFHPHSKGTFSTPAKVVLGGMLGRGLLYSNSKFDPSQHYITYSLHPVKWFNATCIFSSSSDESDAYEPFSHSVR